MYIFITLFFHIIDSFVFIIYYISRFTIIINIFIEYDNFLCEYDSVVDDHATIVNFT